MRGRACIARSVCMHARVVERHTKARRQCLQRLLGRTAASVWTSATLGLDPGLLTGLEDGTAGRRCAGFVDPRSLSNGGRCTAGRVAAEATHEGGSTDARSHD